MNKDKKVDLCVEDAVDRLFFPVLILPEYIIVHNRSPQCFCTLYSVPHITLVVSSSQYFIMQSLIKVKDE